MVCVTPQKLLRESGKYVVVTDTSSNVCVCVCVYVCVSCPYVCLSAHPPTHSTSYEHEVFRNAFQKKSFRTAASFCDKSSTLQYLCQNSC